MPVLSVMDERELRAMAWIDLGTNAVGHTIAKTVATERGTTLVAAGTTLTSVYVASLLRRGITRVEVADDAATPEKASAPEEPAPGSAARAVATAGVGKVFNLVCTAVMNLTAGNPQRATRALESDEMRRVAARVPIEEIRQAADGIVAEARAGVERLGSLTYFKKNEDYSFSHAADSAVIAVMIGIRIGLGQDDLQKLARGCLLRDIGYAFVPGALQTKDGRLGDDELALLREHPSYGFRFLRLVDPDDLIANNIAYQHHERQDGKGYPRGLRGTNRIGRPHGSAGQLLLLSEIAAVADVYDALVSNRPRRQALAPEAAAQTVRQLAGSHLNREIVDAFLGILPVFPVGIAIQVIGGRLRGCAGRVIRLNPTRLDRPVIRLDRNVRGEPVAPVEVDLASYPDWTIASAVARTAEAAVAIS